MKKARLLLLVLPLVAGAFYLRTLSSWRPKKVFAAKGYIYRLVFSDDGQTLLVLQDPNRRSPGYLTALDASHDFAPLWTSAGSAERVQFFAADQLVLKSSFRPNSRILDARNGRVLWSGGRLLKGTMSPDGKWLAQRTHYPDIRGAVSDEDLPEQDTVLEPAPQIGAPPTRGGPRLLLVKKHALFQDFAFSPDSSTLAVGVSELVNGGSHLDFYNTKTGKRIRTWNDVPAATDTDNFASSCNLQWSHDGRYLLSVWYDSHYHADTQSDSRTVTVTLWQTSNGKKLASNTFASDAPNFFGGFQLLRDNRVMMKNTSGHVFLDTINNLGPNSRQLLSLPGTSHIITAVSPDDSYMVVGTDTGEVYRQRIQ